MALLATLPLSRTRFTGNTSIMELSCYCKVTNVIAGLIETTIEVSFYFEQLASDSKSLPIHQQLFAAPGFDTPEYQAAIVAANGSVYVAIYEWLKTQPEFVGATDV